MKNHTNEKWTEAKIYSKISDILVNEEFGNEKICTINSKQFSKEKKVQ